MLRANDMDLLQTMLRNPKSGGCSNPNAFTDADVEAWKYVYGRPGDLLAKLLLFCLKTLKPNNFLGAFTPPINYYRDALMRTERFRAKGSSNIVQAPTLIIWGDRDLALSTDLANMSATYCRQAQVHHLIRGLPSSIRLSFTP